MKTRMFDNHITKTIRVPGGYIYCMIKQDAFLIKRRMEGKYVRRDWKISEEIEKSGLALNRENIDAILLFLAESCK